MRKARSTAVAAAVTTTLLIFSTLTLMMPFGKAHAAAGTVDLVSSGLVASDSLTTGNTGSWTFGGDAASQPGAKYSYSEDSQGLHIGVQPAASGTWSGYYAVSGDTSATLFHALVTLPYTSVPDNGFNTGIYVQTSDNDFIDYIGCLAVAVPQGYYWTVVQSYGIVVGSQMINTLYQSPLNTGPLTQDCTVITNGNNYLKVYLGGSVVVDRNNMTLNMPPPQQVYLEPQSSTASSFLTGTYADYYATTNEGVTVTSAPAGGTVEIVDASNNVLASATVAANGSATMQVGKYSLPLSGNVEVFDSSNALVASTPAPTAVWGGDVYQVTAASSSSSSSSTTASSTSSSTSSGGTSQLTVSTQANGGGAITGFYTVLYQNDSSGNAEVVATGYTPAQFTLENGATYWVQVSDYGSYYFQYWSDTGSVNANRTLTGSASLSLTAVMCDGPPGTCADPTPANGITVYAHRIPASYWDPCFATACSAGTGPGATMFFDLTDSSGNVLQTAYADEGGHTFTGLTPGVTYYVYPEDCDMCHGSLHDVVFDHWGGGSTVRPLAATVGSSLDAWYSCTNQCAGG